MLPLDTPIDQLKMIGPVYASRLKKLELFTVGDLLYHVPTRYEDYSVVSKIAVLQPGEAVTIVCTVKEMKNIYTKYGKKIQKAIVTDDTGEMEIIWYNQPYLTHVISPGLQIALTGTVTSSIGHKMTITSPDYEVIKQPDDQILIHSGRLVPVYPETAGVTSKWLRTRINTILYKLSPEIHEFLPEEIRSGNGLIGEKEALYGIHYPRTTEEADRCRKRLAFDELFIQQLNAQFRRKQWRESKISRKLTVDPDKIAQFISRLPFKLTISQNRVVSEILNDLCRDTPMNRLLEGDVGSGKTVVATIAMYCTYLNESQSVLMAPTEILAQQHYATITKLLTPYHVKVGLLTGTTKVKDVTDCDVIVGTHAILFSEKFPRLGLAIIDEQQRFGVEQRAHLREKGVNPHVLSMTATPIPRTIALTLYADLDLSVISEMPIGRLQVKTWVVPKEKRLAAYEWIKKQIKLPDAKRQAFILCPFIEESETMVTVKAAVKEYDYLKSEIFSDFKLGLLHGRLTVREKNEVIEQFQTGKMEILVTTPVVEVGIDIPSATIMLIEGSERFGLAQLHQLRGRVGRGTLQSYCLLFTDADGDLPLKRLKLLETVYNGPELAENDMKLRGSGDLYGTRQHGRYGLKIARFSDIELIRASKRAAEMVISRPKSMEEFPLLHEKMQKYTIREIAPD